MVDLDGGAAEGERVLVLVVAYEAAQHLARMLDRIPVQLLNDPDVDILIIDDGSSDAGASLGAQWAADHQAHNVSVLRNPENQGYGGNQKLGYRIAIEGGYGFVILLHGDGQYAPELLPEFIATWRRTHADVVLGSRMTDLRSARRGRMPLYKLVGNRILTTFQNTLTGRNLSEYHTGYRAFSTAFLRRVPFEINTNDFHFDTEILYQAFHVGASVEEFAIPTHYGDEISRVNGLRYAKDIVATTLQFRLHQVGMLCDLKYRRLEIGRYEEKTWMAYSSHALALREIERLQPKRVLDIGCGPGFLARECRTRGMEVTGIDASPPLPDTMDHFRQMDLETDPTPSDVFSFDTVLLLDVIEHLAEPEAFLLDLRNRSEVDEQRTGSPTFVISTPNVAFLGVRLNLLFGRFTYAERGILDITHKRLFTRKSLLAMLRQCGYEVQRVHASAVPFQAVMRGRLGDVLGSLSAMAARLLPTLFAFQFVVVCRPRAGVMQIIQRSERHGIVVPTVASVVARRIGEQRVVPAAPV